MTCIIQNEIEQHIKDVDAFDRANEVNEEEMLRDLAEQVYSVLLGNEIEVNGKSIYASDVFDEAVEMFDKSEIVEHTVAGICGNKESEKLAYKMLEQAATKLVAIQAEITTESLAAVV